MLWLRIAPPPSVKALLTTPFVGWMALLGLCAAYIQGGIDKALDFHSAVLELQAFGVSWPTQMTLATILTELMGSVLVLVGAYRWLGALWLAAFTLIADFIANRFWGSALPARELMENGFFEHLGLVGGFLYVAGDDLKSRK
jgi:uncharacterized membrane protein YphA (DoxX/SURF4 family)